MDRKVKELLAQTLGNGRYSNSPLQSGDFTRVKFRECKALLAKVFQRCAEEVERLVVDDDKSIMEVCAVANRQAAILRVERGDIACRKLIAATRGNHLNRNALLFFRQKFQRDNVHPTVDQQNRLLRRENVLRGKNVRIKDLSVIEDAPYRRLTGLHEEINLVLELGDILVM